MPEICSLRKFISVVEGLILKTLVRFLVASLCALMGNGAHAEIISYDITISPDQWVLLYEVNNTTSPYGVPANPTFHGNISVDNSKQGKEAVESFSLTTGSKTWVWDEFVDDWEESRASTVTFDSEGNLSGFSLAWFFVVPYIDAHGNMAIFSNNTFSVHETGGKTMYCNGCVSFTESESQAVRIPEPGTWLLLWGGLLAALLTRRNAGAVTGHHGHRGLAP